MEINNTKKIKIYRETYFDFKLWQCRVWSVNDFARLQHILFLVQFHPHCIIVLTNELNMLELPFSPFILKPSDRTPIPFPKVLPILLNKVYQPLTQRNIRDLFYHAYRAVWGESLCVTLYILCQRLNPAFTMADSGKTNESGAEAAEPDNGDQQVRSAVTRNDTYYKTQAYYELIWRSISHCEESIIIHNRILEHCPERS